MRENRISGNHHAEMNGFSAFVTSQFRGWRASEVLWLAFSIASIVALSLHWGDTAAGITAAAAGMMYTVLAGKGKASCFLFGLVNTPLYAWIAFKAGYYGDFAMNIYYFAMMFPGLAAWLRHRSAEAEEGIVRTRLSAGDRLLVCAACAAGVPAVWGILHLAGGSRPFCDALTNVLSVAAMFLTVKRAMEEWVLWIIVNAVEVFMWWKAYLAGEGSVSVLLMWLLFLANGIYLLSLWVRLERRKTVSAGRIPPVTSSSAKSR
jgi:nicotinamide mononucleotide transporter